MPTWEAILATLIFLQAPGKSLHSMVTAKKGSAAAYVDDVNGVRAYRLLKADETLPPQCQQRVNVACMQPRKRDVIYNLRRVKVSYQRPETYDEGIVRYATIAKAIHDVLGEQKWKFPAGQLSRYLVSIAYHESGFRRDVHIGRGKWAIGDCKWRKAEGPKGRERIPGSCRSHGLFQSLFDPPSRARLFGYRATEVIGDDLSSTKRAVRVAAKHLDRIYKYCSRTGPRPFPGCVFATYGGVGNPNDRRIRMRVATFSKISDHAPSRVDDYVARLVGIERKKDSTSVRAPASSR